MALDKGKLAAQLDSQTKSVREFSDVADSWANAIHTYFLDVVPTVVIFSSASKDLIAAPLRSIGINPTNDWFATNLSTGISAYVLAAQWGPKGSVVRGQTTMAEPASLKAALVAAFMSDMNSGTTNSQAFERIADAVHTYMTSVVVVTGYDAKGNPVPGKLQ